jgi:hypothetical protein
MSRYRRCRRAAGGVGDRYPTVKGRPLRVTLAAGFVTLNAMQKWEYVTVPLLVHATKQILDNWGEDGWELVQVVPGPNSDQLVAYMKRAKS